MLQESTVVVFYPTVANFSFILKTTQNTYRKWESAQSWKVRHDGSAIYAGLWQK